MAGEAFTQGAAITLGLGLGGFVYKMFKPLLSAYRQALDDASKERGELHAEVDAAKALASRALAETEECRRREEEKDRRITALEQQLKI